MNDELRPIKVFIGLTEVAGYYSQLERGLRSLDVDARFFDLSGNPLRYASGGIVGSLKRPATSVSRLRGENSGLLRRLAFRVIRGAYRLVAAVVRLWLFGVAIMRYDVFIFEGTDSFFGYRDLPILKRLGKRVIYVFTGSDHRPPYLNGKWVRRMDLHEPEWLTDETRKVARRVAVVERYADCILAHSASAQFHTRKFVQVVAIGLPFQAPEVTGVDDRSTPAPSGRVRILHAPTDTASKGSDRIRTAVEHLRSKGHPIDYVEIVGRPNSEVLEAIRGCDFVVDEVWSDTPMAGLATEAAFFSRPTVVAGYFAGELETELDEALIPPSLYCVPHELEAGIERLLTDREFRLDLGRRAHDFVTEQWRPDAVARRFLHLIEGDIPEGWWFDPQRIRYVYGWGLPGSMVQEAVSQVLRTAGPEGLMVAHNPELQAGLVALAAHGRQDAVALP